MKCTVITKSKHFFALSTILTNPIAITIEVNTYANIVAQPDGLKLTYLCEKELI